MTYQAIRALFEIPVIDAMATMTDPVSVYVDNQAFTTNDSSIEYVLMRLDFGTTTEDVLQTSMENIKGSIVIEFYTSKDGGPARAQEVSAVIATALNGVGRTNGQPAVGAYGVVRSIVGPNFYALTDRPFYVARLSGAFMAGHR